VNHSKIWVSERFVGSQRLFNFIIYNPALASLGGAPQ